MSLLVIIGLFIIASALSNCSNLGETEDFQHNDTIPLTKHWEKAIPNQTIPEGLSSIRAKDCGSCHSEIYKEWKESTHAVAFQDLQFQAEWKKDNVYACLNCHIPLQNQQEFIVTGLLNGDYKTPAKIPNPYFDKKLQLESITCATCHVRDGNVIGAIGSTNAPHKTIKDVKFLSEQICISCHNVVEKLSPTLVCTFETGDEWNNNWAKKSGKTCISCHMPKIERSISLGMQKRNSHSHSFPGSGIPKFFGMKAIGMDNLEIKESTIKGKYTIGNNINYSLVVKNSYAGHSVPTGDPERFFLITFQLIDNQGNIIKKEEHRIGEEWQWYPVAKKLSDNNLQPKEERKFIFDYIISQKEKLTLFVEVTKHRITKENAKHNGILGKYPLFINIFKKQYDIRSE